MRIMNSCHILQYTSIDVKENCNYISNASVIGSVVSAVNCRIVNYVWTEPAPANAGDDRGAASPVSATNKRPQGSQLQRFPHTTIDHNVAAGLVPA